jgi:hypothetical protein
MLRVEDLPCSLVFSLLDDWLSQVDLLDLDSAMTNRHMREKYLRTITFGNAFHHHNFVLNDASLRWMSTRRVTSSTFTTDIAILMGLFSSQNPYKINADYVTTLKISCPHSPLNKSKKLKDAFKYFPRLKSISITGSYLPHNSTKQVHIFQEDLHYLATRCKNLGQVKLSRIDVFTDDALQLLATNCKHLKVLIIDTCPRITMQSLQHCLEAGGIEELVWHAFETVSEAGSKELSVAISSASKLHKLSLIGPGFSRHFITLSCKVLSKLTHLVITHADLLHDHDVLDIIDQHGARLVGFTLLKCSTLSDPVLQQINLCCKAGQLRTLRLHSTRSYTVRYMSAAAALQALPEQPREAAVVVSRLAASTVQGFATKFGATLSCLQLSGIIGMDDRAVALLCKHCTSLRILYLYNNYMLSDKSLVKLCLAYGQAQARQGSKEGAAGATGAAGQQLQSLCLSRSSLLSQLEVDRAMGLFGDKLVWV